jgi:preprotein translocase subunit SecY
MDIERMLKPALIGGVLLGILSSLPVINLLNCVCCAWIIGGGMLAAYLYVKESPAPVSLGNGVALGLLTGIAGGIISALFSLPLHFLINRGGMGMAEQLRQALDQVPNMPPETRAALESIFSRGDMGTVFFALSLLITLVISCLFAMLGGAIGVAVFERRKPGGTPEDPTSYRPPENLPPPPPDTQQ